MNKYKKLWLEALELKDKFFALSWRNELAANDAIKIAKEAINIAKTYKGQLSAAKDFNAKYMILLDSYMENNSRQAQDIIELESVAIALYDVLWHQVHSVENELEEKHAGVADLNAYKTIKALFEAEGDEK